MQTKVSTKGQVVIPSPLRRKLAVERAGRVFHRAIEVATPGSMIEA